jgi:prephenate dehydrogenase
VEAIAAGPGWPLEQRLAAAGWASMTRLARGDVEMGTGILATNGPAVAERLREMRRVLDGWLAELDADPPDPAGLRERLTAARALLATPGTGDGR